MGQSLHSNYQTLLSHSPNEWFTVGSHHSYEILKNKNTHQLTQQYIISIQDQPTLNKQLQIYEYRRIQTDNIVSVLQLQKIQTNSLCSNTIALKVITERIPHRISDVKRLTLPEALYIIKTALLGFRTIYQHDGALIIDQQMIGFNSNGKVKVWLNSTFGSNQRSFVNKRFMNTKNNPQSAYQNQLNMIQTIFNLVITKLPNQYQQSIRNKLGEVNGFFSALNFVDDFGEKTTIVNRVSEQAFTNKKILNIKPSQEKQKKQIREYSLTKKPNLIITNNDQGIKRNRSYNRLDQGLKGLRNSRQKTKESTSSSSSIYKQTKNTYGFTSIQNNINYNPEYKKYLPPSVPKPYY